MLKRNIKPILHYFSAKESKAKAEALNKNLQRFVNTNYGARNIQFFLFRIKIHFAYRIKIGFSQNKVCICLGYLVKYRIVLDFCYILKITLLENHVTRNFTSGSTEILNFIFLSKQPVGICFTLK